ncbi:MAG: hypothetical protein OEM02_00435 [Desulfobulbaceae bacterium]|nr:hypothetical protein [Desulfobulbaceae bacterium]
MNHPFLYNPKENDPLSFKTYFSPSKFKPPKLRSEKILERRLLIESYPFLSDPKKRLMIVEASAGSGKTVFTQQCIQTSDFLFGWCQIQRDDRDSVELMGALLTLLSKTLPGFYSQRVEQALAEGAINHNEVDHYGKLLAEEIQLTEPCDYVLVIDDLHEIEKSDSSMVLLAILINSTPTWFKWYVISRHPVRDKLRCDPQKAPFLQINPHSLSFSYDETSSLFRDIYKIPLTLHQLNHIQTATEGWVYSLTMIGLKCLRNMVQGATQIDHLDAIVSDKDFELFFTTELLHDFTENQFDALMRISLLDELPLSLIKNLLNGAKALQLITILESRNYFLRCLDDQQEVYGFHHLFRETLRMMAVSSLPTNIIVEIYGQAASYYLLNGEIIKALDYGVKAADYKLCGEILKKYGLDLYGINQITSIYEILSRIAEPEVLEHSWISLYFGICLQDTTPMHALPFYENAHLLFRREEDELGLLLTLNQLVEFHVIIDCQFQKMDSLLPTIEVLSTRLNEQLPLLFQIRSAYMLAFGYCFLQSDMAKVNLYTTQALKLCQNGSFDNQIAMIHLIRGYQHAFVGDWEGVRDQIEISLPMFKNPRVASLSKLFLQMMQINTLEMVGDFFNYRARKQILEQVAEQDIVLQSIIAPFIAIWDIDSAIAEDRIEDALRIIDQGLQGGFAAAMPHMRSQFLHYKALLAGMQGDEKGVIGAARKSLQLRKQVGGKAFIILNYHIVGAAYAQVGLQEAFEHFQKAQVLSVELGEKFQWVSIHAHRAASRLKNNDIEGALKDVRQCLSFLRQQNYVHFFSWTPRVMQPVISTALQYNIEFPYAKKLAKERLGLGVDHKGRLIPLLTIKVLGEFSFSLGGKTILGIDDFTPHQRKLLTLLLSSPSGYLGEEQIEHILWADKSPKKQRSSLHNLLSRLRKMVEGLTEQQISGSDYLTNEKGIIRLHNSLVDCYEFLKFMQKGLTLGNQRKVWQASNSFYHAFSLWKGVCMPGVGVDQVDDYRELVERQCVEGAKYYGDILMEQNQNEQALPILELAFRLNPLDHEAGRKCYELYAATGNHKAAAFILKRYTTAYRQLEDDPAMIDEALKRFSFSNK